MYTWKNFVEQKKIHLKKEKIIKNTSNILSFGSCFAVEIRKKLREKKLNVLPDYFSLKVNESKFRIGSLPIRDNINHYNTYTILYEFMRYNDSFKQDKKDFWKIEDKWFGNTNAFQDPYRRAIYANSEDLIFDITNKLNDEIYRSINISNIIIITLGLTEVWIKNNNNKISCMNPGYAGGGGFDETVFYASTYDDNIKNLRQIMDIINKNKINSKVIFTVSPVPLGATFTKKDVVIANEESKSILRVAAAQIEKEYEKAFYFPAYEFCKYSSNVFLKDGRHVRPDMVDKIIELFEYSYL